MINFVYQLCFLEFHRIKKKGQNWQFLLNRPCGTWETSASKINLDQWLGEIK